MTWIGFFVGGWGSLFTAYVVLQTLAALRLQGARRVVVLIPAIPMVVVLILTISAYMQQSNLWPILLILASPIALVFIGVVWAVSVRAKRETVA